MSSPRIAILRMHLASVQNRINESLLFIPALMVAGAILLAVVMVSIDARVDAELLPPLLRLSPEATIQLLSTLAGATVTTAGVVFSLIVVSLQLASGQFSPRVLRTLFRDRLGKLMVGMLASVFVYSVITLQLVPEPGDDGDAFDVPDLTVNIAVLLTVLSVALLVVYLDRIARRQYVGTIVADITRETLAIIEDLKVRHGPEVPEPDVTTLGRPLVVRARADGWVQQISRPAMLAAAPPGSIIRLETRAGAFVARGIPLASIWPPPPNPAVSERAVQAAVVVGDERTMQQDLDFGLRQLTDIALRALSPAVNDPTTAVEVVLRLASILRPLLLTELPPQVVRSQRGVTLWTPWDLDHAEYVRHAFDQLRRNAAPHPQVAVALVRSLRMLLEAVEDAGLPEAHRELERQLALTLEGARQSGMLREDYVRMHEAAMRPQDPRREQPASRITQVPPTTH